MSNEMFNMVKAVVGVGVLSLPAGECQFRCCVHFVEITGCARLLWIHRICAFDSFTCLLTKLNELNNFQPGQERLVASI